MAVSAALFALLSSLALAVRGGVAFSPPPSAAPARRGRRPRLPPPRPKCPGPVLRPSPSSLFAPIGSISTSSTALRNGVIIDVDDNFFTYAFFSVGLFYSLGKAYNRYLLEEVAFERRREEALERRLDADPTLSEYDARREESAGWRSVYGRRGARGAAEGEEEGATRGGEGKATRRSRAAVLDRDEFDEAVVGGSMTDDQIEDFESRYGVDYDPYYDEPYEESELPEGVPYKEDKSYGDRRYENGEVFYKDESTGMYYRQGSRPRQRKFWDMNSS
ncbi:hypothetical protein ACHAWF_001803 [Thalassiosira exigua]